jgi:hypothetical protein
LTPSPSQVAPSGAGLPGHTRGALRAAGGRLAGSLDTGVG